MTRLGPAHRALYVAALLALVLGIAVAGLAATTISVDQAKSVFEKYCRVCHDGVHALSFQKILEVMRGWAAKYPSLDAAVQKEYGAASYKALMDKMKKLAETKTGMSIPSEDFDILYKFFEEYFAEAKKSPAAPASTVTVTLTTLKTVTTTSTAYLHVTVTVKRGAPGNTAKLLSDASIASAIIIAIAAILIAYRLK